MKSYNYNRFAVESVVPFTGMGTVFGGVLYITQDHGKNTTLSDHIMGGGFYATAGAVSGFVLSALHPILFAGLVVGVPSYAVQMFRDRKSA